MPCIPEIDLGRRLADFSAISWGICDGAFDCVAGY
jgi:hypothetical protein